jgi:eukaryotic-like serine/threonine-protein kinase
MKRDSARLTVTEQHGCALVRLEGDIDQTFDTASLARRQGIVVVDFDGVRRITSHGVLQWISCLRATNADYLGFINCRPPVMDQFNLVSDFPQGGELLTFYAPYLCASCQKETERLINRCEPLPLDRRGEPSPFACPSCGEPAELDEVPDLYFKYALAAPAPRPPAAVSALIGSEPRPPGADRRFEMTKIVTESVTAFVLSGHLDRAGHFKRAADGLEGQPVLDLAALEGLGKDGAESLGKFLAKLGPSAVLGRVPAAMLEPLAALYGEKRPITAPVVSFLVPLRCTGCRSLIAADVAADRISDLLRVERRVEQCPRCTHPLESQWGDDLVASAGRLPAAAMPPPLSEYLRAHRPSSIGARLDDVSPTIDPRHLVLGKYRVLQPLGRGGMGEVFLARQVGPSQFEKMVVLKRIRRDRLGDPRSREMFLSEARLAARLVHPNVVQIYDLEKLENEYLISMEYVNGIDLGSALQLSRGLRLSWPIEICCRVVVELCEALQAAHSYHDEEGREAPIIHRDVSPSNILLSTDGEVKLADFGIAGEPDEPTDPSVPVLGKSGYSAPEQAAGSNATPDARNDIYAAGVVLYECVTLRSVAQGNTATPTVPGVRTRLSSPPHICVARSAAPPLLQDVFERAVQPEPSQRYRSARDLGRDLERISRMVGEATREDLALWVKRLVAVRQESGGQHVSPIVTMETATDPSRRGFDTLELGRGH